MFSNITSNIFKKKNIPENCQQNIFGKKKAIASNRFLERNEKKLPKISTFLNFAVIMKDVSI